MVADVDEVETGLVRLEGVPEHGFHLVDTVLQSDTEEHRVVICHRAIQSGSPITRSRGRPPRSRLRVLPDAGALCSPLGDLVSECLEGIIGHGKAGED